MRLSECFSLNGSQEKMDFVDVLTETDVKLFIDPILIDRSPIEKDMVSSQKINNFFENIFHLYDNENRDIAHSLLDNAHEPQETKIGLSSNGHGGRGTSKKRLTEIFDAMEKEGLIGSGILASYAETTIFLEDFAEDRMSDLITNIIRDQLAKYTVEQCEYHGIPLSSDKENVGVYWDLAKQQWLDCYSRALYVEGKLTLLVPKRLVVRRYISTASNYVQQVIFKHRKNHHENSYGTDSRSLARRVYIKTRKRHEIKPPSNNLLREEEIKKPGLNDKKYAIINTENNLQYITEFKYWISMTLGKENNYTLNNQSLYDFIERHRKRDL